MYNVIKVSGESNCVTDGLVVGEVITIPDGRFKYSDNTYCSEIYFDRWPEYFEECDT